MSFPRYGGDQKNSDLFLKFRMEPINELNRSDLILLAG